MHEVRKFLVGQNVELNGAIFVTDRDLSAFEYPVPSKLHQSPDQIRETRVIQRCAVCHNHGHNSRTCPERHTSSNIP